MCAVIPGLTMSRACAICQPLGVPCEQCDGASEATHRVVVGHEIVDRLEARIYGTGRAIQERWKPMCHGCAVDQRAERDASHAD